MASVIRCILFNKPFQVLCQFSREGDKKTLADYVDVRDVYPAGRLDFDSEGLVLLTNHGALQHLLTDPRFGHLKTYWVQVEGTITANGIGQLTEGVLIAGRRTMPCEAEAIGEPALPARNPPVRSRKSIPTSWLSLTLREGRNRQVRHMTAAVGLPTLRLIRVKLGGITIDELQPGKWRDLTPEELRILKSTR